MLPVTYRAIKRGLHCVLHLLNVIILRGIRQNYILHTVPVFDVKSHIIITEKREQFVVKTELPNGNERQISGFLGISCIDCWANLTCTHIHW